MTCQEYSVLLGKLLDGSLTAAEEALLRQHEAGCPNCKAKRLALDSLPERLTALREDAPPAPEDFHAGWMKQVEECAMENKPSAKRTWIRILSAAAALVFVIGGTLLTRDSLLGTAMRAQSNNSAAATKTAEYSYDTTADYGVSRIYAGSAGSTGYTTDLEMETYSAEESSKKIIRTASLTISTPTFEESLAQLKALCEDEEGWVSYSSESENNARRTASLTMRIPALSLDTFLEGTGSIGRITRREETADDVTESYQDTEARLATQQALMARLQALVTDAADLSDLLALESQIADTQYTIDRLQASLNSTDRQVDYATVYITLREELPSDSITDADLTLAQRLTNALSAGWNAFIGFAADAVVFLVAALPFLVIVAVFYVVVRAVIRRKKKR